MSRKHEQEYFDALRQIAKDFDSPKKLRLSAQRRYGLLPEEALEMAYENIQMVAADAIRGRRRPLLKDGPL